MVVAQNGCPISAGDIREEQGLSGHLASVDGAQGLLVDGGQGAEQVHEVVVLFALYWRDGDGVELDVDVKGPNKLPE
jgi:hypothetical protein